MSPASDTLALIRSSFAGRDRLIEHAYRESRAFRELCEDYRRCAAALDRWKRLNGRGVPSRSQEYTELLAELTREIESCLDVMKVHPLAPIEGTR